MTYIGEKNWFQFYIGPHGTSMSIWDFEMSVIREEHALFSRRRTGVCIAGWRINAIRSMSWYKRYIVRWKKAHEEQKKNA